MTARFFLAAALAATLVACDAGFDGSPTGNAAPDTELSVRSTDLTEDLDGRRLVSTVVLAWSGTDADGVVTAFEVRAYQRGAQPAPEAGWTRTARRDSTILLPIPLGQDTANVAVEVRSIDNDGAVDETPARTVFPIRNSNPAISLSRTEVPPDTTWPVLSFAFAASDPDGELNLAGIEIALDTNATVARLPADATFATLVADDPSADVTEARVFIGRGFSSSELRLPNFDLDAENTVYVRSVDQAGATSDWRAYPDRNDPDASLYVRRVTSPVLLVNDFRRGTADDTGALGRATTAVSAAALALHGTTAYDTWDLSATVQSAANPQFSDELPSTADPTLRQTLALWNRIVWVTNASTNSATANNLPRAATVLGLFFDRGGRMLVHSPVSQPLGAQGGTANAAIDVLPLRELITYPDGVTTLRAPIGTPVVPAASVPGTSQTLPRLRAARFVISTLPYVVGPDDVPLYRMQFNVNNTTTPWDGSDVVASIRSDRRVALFALPLFAGDNPIYEPDNDQNAGVPEALAVLLDALDFPG